MIRDVLIHGDGSAAFERALSIVEATADPAAAHVTAAVFRDTSSPNLLYPPEAGAALWVELARKAEADFRALKARIEGRLRALSVPNDTRGIDASLGEAPRAFARCARAFDLAVIGLPGNERTRTVATNVFEATLFESGRPVLLVPEAASARRPGARVLVAWNGSRESSRALHDALPLIAQAEIVRVIAVEGWDAVFGEGEDPVSDVARHLSRHVSNVEGKVVPSLGESTARVLLAEADYLDADLIVLGGYGHSRAREWILGGVTRELIAGTRVPLLLSH